MRTEMADARGFLAELGVEVLKERGDELECRCPFCEGDDRPQRVGHLYVNCGDKPGVGHCKHADCPAAAGASAVQLALWQGLGKTEARDLAARYGLVNGHPSDNGSRVRHRGPLAKAELARSKGVSMAALDQLGAIEIAPFTTPGGKPIGGGVGFPMHDGGGLARIVRDENGRALVNHYNESAMRGRLARIADFMRPRGRKGKATHISPPLEVVRDLLALGDWPFPPLVAVTETPVVLPDGSVATTPGYDPTTQVFYAPNDALAGLSAPQEPTQAQAAAALLGEAICDFPFADEASRANAFAMMLTAVARPALVGLVPLAIIDAPKQASGKTLLADVACIIATGRPGAMMGAPVRDRDGEWDKRITALLREGAGIIVIDNIEGVVRAPSLCRALTCHTWTSRVLGLTQMLTLPQRSTWIATGNNISLAGDLPRRCFWVHLDPKMARPEKRADFRHPRLLEWVSAKRCDLVAALLTLIRAWYVAGKPVPDDLPTFGSFDEWVGMIGGALALAGVEGFLGNQDSFRDRQSEDEREWEAFLWAWWRQYGSGGVLVQQLVADLHAEAALLGALPADLAESRAAKTGSFQQGPSHRVHGRFQKVRGKLRADIRNFAEDEFEDEVPTRAGLSLEPEQLDDLAELVEQMRQAREEVLAAEGEPAPAICEGDEEVGAPQ